MNGLELDIDYFEEVHGPDAFFHSLSSDKKLILFRQAPALYVEAHKLGRSWAWPCRDVCCANPAFSYWPNITPRENPRVRNSGP